MREIIDNFSARVAATICEALEYEIIINDGKITAEKEKN